MKLLKVRLSEDEWMALKAFAAEHDVKAAHLGVALARWVQAGAQPAEDFEECKKHLVEEAARIGRERKDRHPKDGDEDPEDEDD